MFFNGCEEKLFAKSVPISIRDEYTNQSRSSHLFLTMEWQDASAMMYSKKVLSVSLTDENDPFFLYTLDLSEEEFQMLKTSQDLRINFVEFPQHIIAYINKCLDEEKNPQPKFLLVFTVNEKLGNAASSPKFDIIETNQFKNLTYLSLKFVAATESAVRQYITTYFRNLKENKHQLLNKSAFLEQDLKNQLTNYQQSLHSKDQELELLRKELEVKLSLKDTKHSEELQKERNSLLIRLKEQESRFERERDEKDYNYRVQIQQLESKANNRDILNKELQEKNFNLESTIRDLKLNIISLEDKTKKLKDDVQSYKEKYDSIYSEAQSKELQIQDQDDVINDLERKLFSKEQYIERLGREIEDWKEQKKKLEEKLESENKKCVAHESKIILLENDKKDLNRVLINLQDKIKKLKSKIDFDANYKLAIEEKEKALECVQKEASDLNYVLGTKVAEIKSLKDEMSSLKKDIASLEEELHTKENIITYLSRNLTEKFINPDTLDPSTSPSIIAQKQLAKMGSSATKKLSSPNNHSPVMASNNVAAKSVKITTPSQSGQKMSSTPSRFHSAKAADSAYYTAPSNLANQMTPETFPNSNRPVAFENYDLDLDEDLREGFDLDPEALSAAFGNSNPVIKHSTAKKPTKSSKSTTSRYLKKR